MSLMTLTTVLTHEEVLLILEIVVRLVAPVWLVLMGFALARLLIGIARDLSKQQESKPTYIKRRQAPQPGKVVWRG